MTTPASARRWRARVFGFRREGFLAGFVWGAGIAALVLWLATAAGCGQPHLAPAVYADSNSPTGYVDWQGRPVPASEAAKPTPTPKPAPKPDAAQAIYGAASNIGWIGRILALLSVLTLVASYLPFGFSALIPRKAAFVGFGVAVALALVHYQLLRYGVALAEVTFWASIAASIAAGVFVGYPLAVAWRNRLLAKEADALIAKGDARAGVALKVAAMPAAFTEPGAKSAELARTTGAA